MPASHQRSARTGSQRSILLLEEYDALAAALGSALKKFAPNHKTSVARSLEDAEKLAAELKPDVFVIDADPLWPGVAEFLWNLRKTHPGSRALVIGAGIPPEIAAERGSFGALQFINKPFDLSELGAAVQAMLGPWRESESAAPRGSLSVLKPIDILLLHCAAGATASVSVEAGAKRSGKIHLAEGQVSHAETRSLKGTEALSEILSWSNAHISDATTLISPRRTIHKEWIEILVEALREDQGEEAPVKISPKETPVPKPRVKTGKKILVIDDTEMLLIFVADTLSTADPELQITTAQTGSDGVAQANELIPDLILLDYSLPDFDGDAVCERLLENERTSNVPVLMMSGHVAAMALAASRFPNVVATIEKPFLSDALVQLLKRTLAAGPAGTRKQEIEPPVSKREKIAPPEPAAKPPPEPVPAPKPEAAQVFKPIVAPVPWPVPVEMPRAKEPQVARTKEPVVSTTAAIPGIGTSDTVLGLFLDVMAMQLTPELQMGAIRAKPSSLIASLQLPSLAVRSAIPEEMGFQLGPAELDRSGRIATLRIVPTAKPFQPAQTRSSFQIGGVSVVPNDSRSRVQLTPAGTTPMTMELLARLELAGAELSSTFQVARLVLKWRSNIVRVTLNPKAPEQSAARFEIVAVRLDDSRRLAELVLRPVK